MRLSAIAVFVFLINLAACHQAPPSHTCHPLPNRNQPIAIKPKQTHCYHLDLEKGARLEIRVDQHLVDVSLQWVGPDGRVQVTMDHWDGSWGQEWLQIEADRNGVFELKVVSDLTDSEKASYRLEVSSGVANKLLVPELIPDLRGIQTTRWDKPAQKLQELQEHVARTDQSGWPPAYRARVWQTIAFLAGRVSNKPQAYEALRQAHLAFEQDGDYAAAALYGFKAARAAGRLNQMGRAGEHLDHAYHLGILSNQSHLFGRLRSNHAHWLMQRGRFQQAKSMMLEALDDLKAKGDRRGTARQLDDLGLLSNRLAQMDEAQNYFGQAAELWKEIGPIQNHYLSRSETAWSNHLLGNSGIADEIMTEMIEKLEQRNLPNYADPLYDRLGSINLRLKNFEAAREYYQTYLESKSAVGDRRAATYLNMAELGIQEGNLYEARDYAQKALEIYDAESAPLETLHAGFLLARIHAQMRDQEQAVGQAEQALQTLHALREAMDDPAAGLSFMGPRQDYIAFTLDLLYQFHQDHPERGFDLEALRIFEMFQARYLVKAYHSRQHRKQISRKDQATLSALRLERGELYERREDLHRKGRTDRALQERLGHIQEVVETLQGQPVFNHSNDPFIEHPDPASAALALSKQWDGAMLVYHLGDPNSFLWIITSETFEMKRLPPRNEIITELAFFFEYFHKDPGDHPEALGDAAAAVGELLLGPIVDTVLKNADAQNPRRLLIVADDHLNNLPFNMLTVPGTTHALVDIATTSMHPSITFASLMQRERRVAATRRLLLFANPAFSKAYAPLAETAHEAACLQQWIPAAQSTLRTQNEATLTEWHHLNAGDYDLIHFATHGENPYGGAEEPETSAHFKGLGTRVKGLIFAPDDRNDRTILRIPEIQSMDFKAQLVTLSACYSGVSDISFGEGALGLDEVFLGSGARRVLAGLRKVDDNAGRVFMCAFYEGFLNQGLAADEAVRRARLKLRGQAAFRDPRFWAPFVLNGDPGPYRAPKTPNP
ncbi:CHAT domain-containing protein [Acanthopleuribacter pedis]|uniref:CHAT domain-containing protein n=1 Tax=Acanthopleuribacter pedis TaxID=442870 RepID=A0A8J7QHC8_9BACT|nr:CHAT domain-containing tetratricopeptide repeat protein [Acanthopleuribacter pedis]MBO1320471.1 CHAT domain-containing protein [Acanthopleuribacter pedis]